MEDEVRNEITAIFDVELEIKNKLQLNDALYKMLNSENLAVYLIFTLVLIIALFNVVGSIIMMILDKKKNLKTLADLGAEVGQLRRIFFLQGTLMTLSGGIIGTIDRCRFCLRTDHLQLDLHCTRNSISVCNGSLNVLMSLLTIAVLGIIASYIGTRRINDRLLSQAKL